METLLELLYKLDWSTIFAGLAFIVSFFALYFAKFNRGKMIFACSRWTALGLDNDGKRGAAFAINIESFNTGAKPVKLFDFLLVAETVSGSLVYYDPIFLFSMNSYIQAMGQQNQIGQANNGTVPLPIIIPNGATFKFPCELLFMPQDKKTTVLLPEDAPFKLKLYARIDNKKYKKISEQFFSSDDINNLRNGSFSGVISTSSIEERNKFIKRHMPPNKS